jgi:hypothetical protein
VTPASIIPTNSIIHHLSPAYPDPKHLTPASIIRASSALPESLSRSSSTRSHPKRAPRPKRDVHDHEPHDSTHAVQGGSIGRALESGGWEGGESDEAGGRSLQHAANKARRRLLDAGRAQSVQSISSEDLSALVMREGGQQGEFGDEEFVPLSHKMPLEPGKMLGN